MTTAGTTPARPGTTTPHDPAPHDPAPHAHEPHRDGLAARLNRLRAGVLGANDGIVSVAAVVVGVAGATTAHTPVLLAGVAALIGGAVSMALGEYVSVSSQRDSQRELIALERRELEETPDEELAELAAIYRGKGLSEDTAHRVAVELTAHDALGAHLSAELGIDREDVVSPWSAALASAVAFLVGAALPLAAVLLAPDPVRVAVTVVAVLLALAVTGALGARLGGAAPGRAVLRTTVGGAVALAVTYGAGALVGGSGLV